MIDEILKKLTESAKYRDVCPDTIARIAAETVPKYKKAKDAEKAVREALHGITSAFMTDTEYKHALKHVRDGETEQALACHASTRERLPVSAMEALYAKLFALTGMPDSVADFACGLNPLFLASYLPENVRMLGLDISGQCIRILENCGKPNVQAMHADLLTTDKLPKQRFHTALMFKILPLLERQKKGASRELLRSISAENYILSFPTRTLSGRNVGMEKHYSESLPEWVPEELTEIGRVVTDNEMYIVMRNKENYG